MDSKVWDVIIIGGGQSGLAVGYYLRRSQLDYLILDSSEQPGGSWPQYWKSLRLFSPAQWSSLPGILFPGGADYYPGLDEAIRYLQQYEQRYKLPILRPVQVEQVSYSNHLFHIQTSKGKYTSRTIVSATGSFQNPYLPSIPGAENFTGTILHSSAYQNPEAFSGKKVVVVGEGNSGAQILADLAPYAKTFWSTLKEPQFLPDEIDGRYLFDQATARYKAQQEGKPFQPASLGDIVMVPPVKATRDKGFYNSYPPIKQFHAEGVELNNGTVLDADAVIFCTGFRPALTHLKPLQVVEEDGKVETVQNKAKKQPGLWLVGYGNWTGFASATLIGVGRSAKATAEDIISYLEENR